MALAPGTKLGRYEVLAPLGAGGMGEVYRARDTALDGDVAVKVLPDHLLKDPRTLARLQGEAKAVAALSHPGILSIFDAGEAAGVPFAVTELLEGETLRLALRQGAVPLKKALDVAAQLAEALAAAHEAGIVHRDVKPENVFLTKDGRTKLLDFGLARSESSWRKPSDTNSPTRVALTGQGEIVGTVAYMSPEQARGELATFRSDQFSLGSVLYEMLAGRHAFSGATAPEVLTAILRQEPEPLETRAPAVPVPIRWIVERLLAKEPESRYESTRDLARELETWRLHLSQAMGPLMPAAAAPRQRSGRARTWGAAGLALAAALCGVFLLGRHSSVPARPVFQKLTFGKGPNAAARFTPDGNSVVGAAQLNDEVRLFTIRLDSPVPVPLEPGHGVPVGVVGGEIAILQPLVSAGTVSVRRGPGSVLATIPLGGGTPRPILDGVLGADWGGSAGQFAVIRLAGGRSRLEYPPGRVLYETAGRLFSPRIAPDGSRVVFALAPLRTDIAGSVVVVDASGHARQAVSLEGKLRTVLEAPSNLVLRQVFRDGRVLLVSGTWTCEAWGRRPGDEAERSYSWLDGTVPSGVSEDGKSLLLSEIGAGGGPRRSVFLRRLDGSPPVRLGEGRARGLSPDGE